MRRWCVCKLMIFVSILAAAPHALAQDTVGTVRYSKGVVTAQQGDGPPRFLAKGEPLMEGDVVTTGRLSFAVLNMNDGGRLTVRPGTALGLERYDDREEQGGALLRLFRGGMRALTGLISKRRPASYRVQTSAATLGIRGTEFDARICAQDCPDAMRDLTRPPPPPIVGRVLRLRGSLTAFGRDGGRRSVPRGAAVFEGDRLETGARSFAVLALSDGARMTLKSDTVFELERYRAPSSAGESGSALLRLVRGGLRALTGLIGRTRRADFRLQTSVATIGIRGTGFDVNCTGACAEAAVPVVERTDLPDCAAGGPPSGPVPSGPGDSLLVSTWDGAVDVRLPTCSLTVNEGQAAYARADGGAARFDRVPDFLRDDPDPRPDSIPAQTAGLFAAQVTQEHPQEGLYVSVSDGVVALETQAGSVELGPGESGFSGSPQQSPVRLAGQPFFHTGDPLPRPSEFDDAFERRLNLLGEEIGADALECKVQ